MKRYLFHLSVIFLIFLFMGSCKKDCNCVDNSPSLYGSWTVLQTDQQGLQYNVKLRFNTNNSFDWILLDSVVGHTNSHAEFEISGNLMIITLDADCSSIGEYYLTFEDNRLAIIAKTDGCEPRAAGLEWVWTRI